MDVRASLIALFLLAASAGGAHAQTGQNLIRNWSFEELKYTDITYPCPTSPGQISKSKHWYSASGSGGVSMYFNACSNDTYPDYGVPQNKFGQQQAYDGEAYAAIAGYVNYNPGWDDMRTFLFQELETPLLAGTDYRLSFHVSLEDSVNFAMSSMGALLSLENTRYWDNEDFFNATPQVLNPWDNLLDDKEGWTLISDTFTAQGGEKYLTIGCFRRDADDNIQRVSNIPEGTQYWDHSAYYVDGVELYWDRSIGIEEVEKSKLHVYPNPAMHTVRLEVLGARFQVQHMAITDMLGHTVLHRNHATSGHVTLSGVEGMEIDIRHLPTGVYTIAVQMQDGSVARQRLVKH